MSRQEAVAEILEAGRRMYDRQLIVACQGNLSARLDLSTVLTTPAGVCKGKLRPSDLIETDLEGHSRRGRPSSELGMHLAIYALREDVGGVVHGHPPWATALATAGRALDSCLLPEVIVGLGAVPLSRYATPGTPEVAEAVCEYIDRFDAVLMPNHGVVACGDTVLSALHKLETVEHLARITLISEIAGGGRVLSRQQVAELSREGGIGQHAEGAVVCRPADEAPPGASSGRTSSAGLSASGPMPRAQGPASTSAGVDEQHLARIVAEEVARGLLEEGS